MRPTQSKIDELFALREQDKERRLKEAEQVIEANGGAQPPG